MFAFRISCSQPVQTHTFQKVLSSYEVCSAPRHHSIALSSPLMLPAEAPPTAVISKVRGVAPGIALTTDRNVESNDDRRMISMRPQLRPPWYDPRLIPPLTVSTMCSGAPDLSCAVIAMGGTSI